MHSVLRGSTLGGLLFLQSCSANVESVRVGQEPSAAGVAQRVTGTVQRGASRLVRLETERETLLTTPEHPFAVPGSGWIRAGRLVPGSWVVSERGAVRLRSARSEPVARPVPVFNLSVASSHAYFVGTEHVLVHNTKCKADAFEAREAAIERLVRERETLNREIDFLKQAAPRSPRIAELKFERDKVQGRINKLRQRQRIAQGVVLVNRDERDWQRYQAEHDAARKGLEDAEKEMAEIASRMLRSGTEDRELMARAQTQGRQIAALRLSYERTGHILDLLRELAGLAEATATTAVDRAVLEGRKKGLRARLLRERKREADANSIRKKRADPDGRAEAIEYNRKLRRRLRRTPAYLADEERPRDRLEIAEDELGRWLQAAPSESRAARIRHLTDQIDTMKKLVGSRREYERLRKKRTSVQRERAKLLAMGADTSKFDELLEQAERASLALAVERAQLRVRERLLARSDGAPSADAWGSAGEARLREFERQLAGGVGSEQQLAGIERALDAMDPAHADLQEAVQDEVDDVDETLSEREALMEQRPSPERAAELVSSSVRLEQELREERAAVEAALSALANEQAHIQRTQAGSSRGPSWQERLSRVQEEQVQLRAQWRAGLEERLDSARRRLRVRQAVFALRDQAIEAELGREIALLERHLQM